MMEEWNRQGRRLSESSCNSPLFQYSIIPVGEIEVEKEQIEQVGKSFADSLFGDVMVVGGGISGIQASLDLATAGFKVYLVEKAPSIGGHMAQLDKTFPTNDCSM
jgi:heterodisulfide reductase subunit A-like polyferredoxin